jgi:hypothetical protein
MLSLSNTLATAWRYFVGDRDARRQRIALERIACDVNGRRFVDCQAIAGSRGTALPIAGIGGVIIDGTGPRVRRRHDLFLPLLLLADAGTSNPFGCRVP